MESKDDMQKTRFERIKEVATPGQLFSVAVSIALVSYCPTILNNHNEYSRYRQRERPDYDLPWVEDLYMIPIYSIIIWIIKAVVKLVSHNQFK